VKFVNEKGMFMKSQSAAKNIIENPIHRCQWCGNIPEFYPYHDAEWGYPVADDTRLFEKLCLESFQSGLSWRTILNKRNNFRAAFCRFDFYEIAKFTESDVVRLLQDAGIIRHRGKIESVINNAHQAIALVAEYGSLAAYVWQYEAADAQSLRASMRATSPESVAMAKDLKKRGWKFVGPTTAYAFMQAMGLVNDHAEHCAFRQKAIAARNAFTPPSPKKL
jgi:DNA-3-methyladenine glycosylase I